MGLAHRQWMRCPREEMREANKRKLCNRGEYSEDFPRVGRREERREDTKKSSSPLKKIENFCLPTHCVCRIPHLSLPQKWRPQPATLLTRPIRCDGWRWGIFRFAFCTLLLGIPRGMGHISFTLTLV
jgi:hypothetical protein